MKNYSIIAAVAIILILPTYTYSKSLKTSLKAEDEIALPAAVLLARSVSGIANAREKLVPKTIADRNPVALDHDHLFL